MTKLVLYTNPMSRGRIARWMLEETGQPYEARIVEYGAPMKGPEYTSVNPMGKVPALRHGDVVVTEVAAICAYLADVFPEAVLAPAHGSPDRGDYYRWLFFGAGPIESAVTNASFGFVVPEDGRGRSGYGGDLKLVLDTLEGHLKGREYLAGNAFSAADVYVGAQLGFGLRFGTIEKRSVFADYAERLLQRPAAKRAARIDDDLLAKRD